MFLPQRIFESAGDVLSRLFPWEQTTLLIIFCTSFLFLFLFAYLSRSVGRRTKVEIFCGVMFLFLWYLFIMGFGSFAYGNAHGWAKGVLFFCIVPLCFACATLSLIYIYVFITSLWTNRLKKRGLKEWSLLIIAPVLAWVSIEGLVFFFKGMSWLFIS